MNHLNQFFQAFDTKDWITLCASLSAFLFSAISFFQKQGDARQAQRKQLTDLMKELADMNLKVGTFRSLRDQSEYPPNYVGLLNDQRRFMVRQAASLCRQIPKLVIPFEQALIADAFASIDYSEEAEKWHLAAISNAQPGIEKGIMLRGYGRFLFDQLRDSEARQRFSEAAAHFDQKSEVPRFYLIETYVRWAEFESSRDVARAPVLLDKAEDEALKFRHLGRRDTLLKRVSMARKAPLLQGQVEQGNPMP